MLKRILKVLRKICYSSNRHSERSEESMLLKNIDVSPAAQHDSRHTLCHTPKIFIFQKKTALRCAVFSCCILIFGCSEKQSKKETSADTISIPECGIILPLSRSLEEKGLTVDSYGSERTRYPMAVLSFSYLPAIDALYAQYGAMDPALVTQDTVQEFRTKVEQHSQPLATLLVVPTGEYNGFKKNGFPKDVALLSEMHVLGKKYGNTYLFLSFDNDTSAMQEEEKTLFEEIKQNALYAAQNARFTKISEKQIAFENLPEQKTFPKTVPQFTAMDLDGTPVTNSIFSEAELTVLHIWGTFCGPCIQEMPQLAAWNTELEKNVQLVGIVCDVFSLQDETILDAKAILKKANATFKNIVATDSLAEFIAGVQFVPTTVIIDANGAVVTEPIVGASVEKYKEAVEAYFEKN